MTKSIGTKTGSDAKTITKPGDDTTVNTSVNIKEQAFLLAESNARHGAAIFLTLAALIALDTVFSDDPVEAAKRTPTWVAWGITFILVAFFVIAPEVEAAQQEELEKAAKQADKASQTKHRAQLTSARKCRAKIKSKPNPEPLPNSHRR